MQRESKYQESKFSKSKFERQRVQSSINVRQTSHKEESEINFEISHPDNNNPIVLNQIPENELEFENVLQSKQPQPDEESMGIDNQYVSQDYDEESDMNQQFDINNDMLN